MFKSYRNPYYSRRKQRFASPWKVIAFVLIGLIFLEFLTRFFVGLSSDRQTSPEILTAYQYTFENREGKPFSGLTNEGKLRAEPSLGVGYQLIPNRKTDYWIINEQRFRDDQPIPPEKPANEIRIFVLGGSAAFGQWLDSQDATLSQKLEARIKERLKQQQQSPEKYRPDVLPFDAAGRAKALALTPQIRDGNYQVINAAVPGYASGNELAQLALQILSYKPDVIVVLDGYADLMLPQDQEAVQIPKLEDFLNNPPQHFWAYLTKPVKQFLSNITLFQAAYALVVHPPSPYEQKSLVMLGDDHKSLAQHLPADDAELDQRIARYRQNVLQMVQLCAGSNIALVVALQPEITGISEERLKIEQKKAEKAIVEQLGATYVERSRKAFSKLVEVNQQIGKAYPKNVKTLNYYKLFDGLSDVAFMDAIHLNEKGNSTLAEKLYQALTKLPQIQVQPQDPRAKRQ